MLASDEVWKRTRREVGWREWREIKKFQVAAEGVRARRGRKVRVLR